MIDEDIELAELIGILHDIGRFEELKITKELNSVKFEPCRAWLKNVI